MIYELMTKFALSFSVLNLVILYFLLTKMIDYRNKALVIYHILKKHCGVLVELDKFITGKEKK